MKINYSHWDKKRGVIHTKKGGWRIGEAIFSHGYSLLDELVGKVSYFQILILHITGKLPSEELSKWVECIYSCMSFPDSRIWCNQIGSLGGACNATAAASVTAGILASESTMYGPGTVPASYDFLEAAMNKHKNGITSENIVDSVSRRPGVKPTIPGYGRPLATGDERVFTMRKIASELGLRNGPYMDLALEIDNIMDERHNESMNLATYIVAFLRDQDWHLHEICQITSIIVTAGVMACYSEEFDNPPEHFLPLRCTDVIYSGPKPRSVPDV